RNAAVGATAPAGGGSDRCAPVRILGPVDRGLRLSLCPVHGSGVPKSGPGAADPYFCRREVRPLSDQHAVASQSSSIVRPKGSRRSNVVVSNRRRNSRARRQESSSSAWVGRRAMSAYLSRYLALVGSQKLSGWNCSITFSGAVGARFAIHSSTG